MRSAATTIGSSGLGRAVGGRQGQASHHHREAFQGELRVRDPQRERVVVEARPDAPGGGLLEGVLDEQGHLLQPRTGPPDALEVALVRALAPGSSTSTSSISPTSAWARARKAVTIRRSVRAGRSAKTTPRSSSVDETPTTTATSSHGTCAGVTLRNWVKKKGMNAAMPSAKPRGP